MEYQGKPFFIRGYNAETKNLWSLEEGQIISTGPAEGYVHIPPGKRVLEYVADRVDLSVADAD